MISYNHDDCMPGVEFCTNVTTPDDESVGKNVFSVAIQSTSVFPLVAVEEETIMIPVNETDSK